MNPPRDIECPLAPKVPSSCDYKTVYLVAFYRGDHHTLYKGSSPDCLFDLWMRILSKSDIGWRVANCLSICGRKAQMNFDYSLDIGQFPALQAHAHPAVHNLATPQPIPIKQRRNDAIVQLCRFVALLAVHALQPRLRCCFAALLLLCCVAVLLCCFADCLVCCCVATLQKTVVFAQDALC